MELLRPGNFDMGGVSLGGSQAPRAAAGEVWPDPLPVGTGGFGGVLDAAAASLLAVVQLVNAIVRQRALQDLGVAIDMSVQLGRVGANRTGDAWLFGDGHRRHGSTTVGGDLLNTGRTCAR